MPKILCEAVCFAKILIAAPNPAPFFCRRQRSQALPTRHARHARRAHNPEYSAKLFTTAKKHPLRVLFRGCFRKDLLFCGKAGRGSDSPPDCHSLPLLQILFDLKRKNGHPIGYPFFLVAEEGFEPTTFQVAVPEIFFALFAMRKISTAAPFSPRFFAHRARSAQKQVIRPSGP